MYRSASTVLLNVLLAVSEHEANGTAVPNRVPAAFSKLYNCNGIYIFDTPDPLCNTADRI